MGDFDLNETPYGVGDLGVDLNEILVEEEEEINEILEDIDVHVQESVPTPPNLIQEAVATLDSESGVDDIISPEVGMVFQTGEEFAAFIYSYAYKCGFELIIRTNTLKEEYKEKGVTRTGVGEKVPEFYMLKRMRMHCKKGGQCKHPGSNVTKCKFVVDARIRDGKTMMEITICQLEHDHVIVPENRRYMVSYKVISDYFKKRMVQNDGAGISLITNYNSLVLECGGHENVPFNGRDLRNAVNLVRRSSRLGGDAIALEEYFQKMIGDNPDFFFAIQRNTEGCIINVFWADARCRALFKSFPDAVSYDTTFSCNRYEMPFSPFVGVNHHGKSTLFAAALISHEDTETFVWVFERWLECMGKAPSVLITDQDKAIGKAIRIVFGEYFPHRLCLWHIMKNAAKNLGRCTNWLKIEVELRQAVHDSLEAFEFEEAWHSMVLKYQLNNNPWIRESFEVRRQWVPAYWRGTFCAGMSSTQRSEQQNRFIKAFVNVNTGLRNFVSQFENAILEKVNEEHHMDFVCIERPLKLLHSTIVVEEVFHKLYTNAMFKKVQNEVVGLVHTNVLTVGKVGNCSRFLADERIVDPPWKKGRKTYEVTIDALKGEFKCQCKLFEFRGILCRHIIRCLEIEDIKYIPDKYILDRWRKDLVRDYEHIRVGYYDPEKSAKVRRSMELTEKNDYIAKLALQDDESYAIFNSGVADLRKKLEDYVGLDTIKSMGTGSDTFRVWGRRRLQRKENNQRHMLRNAPTDVDGALKDPVDKRGVGRAKITRQKTFKRKVDLSQPETSRKMRATNIGLSL